MVITSINAYSIPGFRQSQLTAYAAINPLKLNAIRTITYIHFIHSRFEKMHPVHSSEPRHLHKQPYLAYSGHNISITIKKHNYIICNYHYKKGILTNFFHKNTKKATA